MWEPWRVTGKQYGFDPFGSELDYTMKIGLFEPLNTKRPAAKFNYINEERHWHGAELVLVSGGLYCFRFQTVDIHLILTNAWE